MSYYRPIPCLWCGYAALRYALFCLTMLIGAVTLAGDANLIGNGSFDLGDAGALHWEAANGLTSQFRQEPGRGRIVVLDTAIDRQQALDWQRQFAADSTQPPPPPQRHSGASYATIGAVEGVMLDSDLIAVTPGQNYSLTVDVKAAAAPFIWIKGFMRHPRRDMLVDAYQTRLVPSAPSPESWHSFQIGFNPTANTPKVTHMKVRLYAYWPNGVYCFDNVRIEAISPQEMVRLTELRTTGSTLLTPKPALPTTPP